MERPGNVLLTLHEALALHAKRISDVLADITLSQHFGGPLASIRKTLQHAMPENPDMAYRYITTASGTTLLCAYDDGMVDNTLLQSILSKLTTLPINASTQLSEIRNELPEFNSSPEQNVGQIVSGVAPVLWTGQVLGYEARDSCPAVSAGQHLLSNSAGLIWPSVE